MPCFNSHKGSVNRPNLGDMWHLGCGSTSPGMTSVSHVNHHHMVGIYLCGSIDPRYSLLCGFRLRILLTPLNANPTNSQVFGLSYLAPRVLFLPTIDIYFGIHEFNAFILRRLLAKFLRSTNSLDYTISCHVPTHQTVLVQWKTFEIEPIGPCVDP